MIVKTSIPAPGAMALHKSGNLDARPVSRVTSRGIWLVGPAGRPFGPLAAADYTYTRPATDAEVAAQRLRELIPVGGTIHTVERHRTRSGTRYVSAFYVGHKGTVTSLDYLLIVAGVADGDRRHEGVKAADTLDLVYRIGRALYPEGVRCTGRRRPGTVAHPPCRSTDHVSSPGRDYSKGWVHADGGYAFRHDEL